MFKFRLEPVLKFRARIVEKFQRELAEVNNAFYQEKDKLEAFKSKRIDSSKECCDSVVKLSITEMMFYDNYFNGMVIEIENQTMVVSESQKKVNEKRKFLIESIKQKKIIETVKERALEKYLQNEKKKEIALLDEVAVTRFKPARL